MRSSRLHDSAAARRAHRLDNARMGVIFPRVGLMSELGSSYLMPRLIGPRGPPR